MLIEGSKWTLLENPFDSTKSKKRKSEKTLIDYRASTIIVVVLRGLQIFSTHFSSHPSDTQEFNQTKSTFSYVNLRFLQKTPRVRPNCSVPPGRGNRQVSATCTLKKRPNCSAPPGRGGRQVSATCILNKRPHLYPQKERHLHPQKGVL